MKKRKKRWERAWYMKKKLYLWHSDLIPVTLLLELLTYGKQCSAYRTVRGTG